ncbi:hypothetical protein [Flavobacterium sp.]|uniref:hypothetical protein n=1 Tax=Flavobacterium sp. TaxID=239 RepID=UPI002600FC41|nr:hypothetical protein [Flavobacterium sp.]
MKEGEYIILNNSNQAAIDKFCTDNEYIYRFLPLERLLETMQSGKMVFVSPKKWNDPFDNFLFRQNIKNTKTFMNKLYVLCFTHNSHSWAYWKTYAPEGYCVRLRIKTRDFLSLMLNERNRIWLGKMKYLKETRIVEELQNTIGLKEAIESDKINDIFIKTFLLKRLPFKYEEESRIIVQSYHLDSGIKSKHINLKDIIKDIYLDPRMGKHETIAWKDYLRQFGIPVIKSQLFVDKTIKIH